MSPDQKELGKEIGEASTAILMLMKNMGFDDSKAFSSTCITVVRLGTAIGKRRQEMRRIFNLLAQQFTDDAPLSMEEKIENFKTLGVHGMLKTGQPRPTAENPYIQRKVR